MHIAHLSYVYITIGFIFQFIDHLTISVFIAVPCRAGLPWLGSFSSKSMSYKVSPVFRSYCTQVGAAAASNLHSTPISTDIIRQNPHNEHINKSELQTHKNKWPQHATTAPKAHQIIPQRGEMQIQQTAADYERPCFVRLHHSERKNEMLMTKGDKIIYKLSQASASEAWHMGRRCQSQCHASDASAHQLASRHLAGAKSHVGWTSFTRRWMSRFARQKWTDKAPMCPMPCNAALKGCPLPDQSLNGLYCNRLLWSLYVQAKLKERNPKWHLPNGTHV